MVDVLQASNPDIAYDLFITKIKTICQKVFSFLNSKTKMQEKTSTSLGWHNH